MNTRGTKVGPRDPVAAELRRMAKRLKAQARYWDKLSSGYPSGVRDGLIDGSGMLERRAMRLEKDERERWSTYHDMSGAARKGAR